VTTDSVTDILASARAEFSGVMVIDTVTTTPGGPKMLYITGAFYTSGDTAMQ
jgi:hypothetical protein